MEQRQLRWDPLAMISKKLPVDWQKKQFYSNKKKSQPEIGKLLSTATTDKIMKSLILLLCLSAFSFHDLTAQSAEKTRVKSGENISYALKMSDRYRFSEFQKGRVFFRNGNSTGGILNYNIVQDHVEFINGKGDTLSLANPEEVERIVIGDAKFNYNKGYYEVISEYPSLKLALRQEVGETNREKIGAYGQRTNTAAITNLSTTQVNNQNINLNSDELIVLSRKVTFFLIDKNDKVRFFNKKNLVQLFPSHKRNIVDFLEKNKIDFNNEADLKKLLSFCSNL